MRICFLIGFCILFCFLIGCTTNQVQKVEVVDEQPFITEEVGHVIERGEIELCNEFDDEQEVLICKSNFSFNMGLRYLDTTYCEILGPVESEQCKNNVLLEKVLVNQDTSYCKEITEPDLRSFCQDHYSILEVS